MSCGTFVLRSHYLPLPILDVPSLLVNSSSHLITCHFPSWTSHLPVVNSSSHLITCHFPSWTSHLPVVNSSSHLITCQFPSWTSHLLSQIRLPISLPATSHLGSPMSCGKFVSRSHYLCHFPSWTSHLPVVNSSPDLITCHFPS